MPHSTTVCRTLGGLTPSTPPLPALDQDLALDQLQKPPAPFPGPPPAPVPALVHLQASHLVLYSDQIQGQPQVLGKKKPLRVFGENYEKIK